MGKLTDILRQHGSLEAIQSTWANTQAASDYGTIPKGDYLADIVSGELFNSSSKGTPGYKLTFQVVDGDHKGKRFWLELWLTQNALPQTKRDLEKIGIRELDLLEKPLPAVFRCQVKLVIERDEDYEKNRVRRFTLVEVIEPTPDVFAPKAIRQPTPIDLDDIVTPSADMTKKVLVRKKVKRRKPTVTKPTGSATENA